jgi:DNA-binding phage protein
MNANENEYVEMYIEDGILIARYLTKKIDLKTAKHIVSARKEFSQNRLYAGLADASKVTSVTRDAREYLSSAEAIEGLLAGAILSGSSFNAFIANFFVKVTQPRIPTRIFTDEDKAIQWLQQFKK